MSAEIRPGDSAEYITSATLKRRYDGVSDMWIHRKIKDAGFPAPVYFGTPQRFWKFADVVEWERSTIANGPKETQRRKVQR